MKMRINQTKVSFRNLLSEFDKLFFYMVFPQLDLASKLNGYSQIIGFVSCFINPPLNLQKESYAAIILLGLNCK